jgi:hypothetical protein
MRSYRFIYYNNSSVKPHLTDCTRVQKEILTKNTSNWNVPILNTYSTGTTNHAWPVGCSDFHFFTILGMSVWSPSVPPPRLFSLAMMPPESCVLAHSSKRITPKPPISTQQQRVFLIPLITFQWLLFIVRALLQHTQKLKLVLKLIKNTIAALYSIDQPCSVYQENQIIERIEWCVNCTGLVHNTVQY